jgi:hypothetical protein
MNIISVFVLDFSNGHIMLFHCSNSIREFQDFEQQVVNTLTDEELSLGGSHVIGNGHIETPDDLKEYDPFFIPYKPVYTIKDYKSYAELAVKQQRLLR